MTARSAYRPSAYHVSPLRELPLLHRGKPYYVQSIYEGPQGLMFVLADFPSFSWPAANFVPCNDAELDGLRQAAAHIDPQFIYQEQQQELLRFAEDTVERLEQDLQARYKRLHPKPLPPIGQRLRIRMPKDWPRARSAQKPR